MRTVYITIARVAALLLAGVLSTALSLLALEVVCRNLFDAMDCLEPELVPDPRLGHRIAGDSGGHDAWGFRNRSVPSHADIVTIGDSMTYGWNATSGNNWPGWLAALSGRSVYNLGVGGYGPVQYAQLLEEKALPLSPSLVVVGFYYGNDLRDAYRVAYQNEQWRGLRSGATIVGTQTESADLDVLRDNRPGAFEGVRTWLGHHSMLYRRLVLSRVGDLARLLEMRVYGATREGYVLVDSPTSGLHAAFAPRSQSLALQLEDPQIAEGMRISLDLLASMNALCRARGISFLVVLIPTKESVFAAQLLRSVTGDDAEVVRKLLRDEERINSVVQAFLDENEIDHVAVLPLLQHAIGREEIYPSHHDVHPLSAGYRIIARAVQEHVEGSRSERLRLVGER